MIATNLGQGLVSPRKTLHHRRYSEDHSTTVSMSTHLNKHLDILDRLLDAGDAGQPLRSEHLPHIGSLRRHLPTAIEHESVSRSKIEVALPPVLLSGYCHVAEVDINSQRVRYKRILNQDESETCTDLLFLREAQTYARQYWAAELHADSIDNCIITQTRGTGKGLIWNVTSAPGDNTCSMGSITRQSQFMELARVARVDYMN
jgi:hypothetical protein